MEGEFFDRMMGRMDKWFDGKVESIRKTSSSRTGRASLPQIMADLIFGPPKD